MLSLELGDGMRRREFITLLGGAAAWPLAARAQQPERIRRVGVLTPYTKQYFVDRNDVASFTTEFQRLGWEEGRNFHLEYRGVEPNEEQLRSAAADLVGLKSEVILVVTSPALSAAQVSTDTIPIVFVGVTDPVDQGFIANLAHPGGNVTGFASFEYSIGSKWLHLLKEVSPDIRHFAVIFHPDTTPGGWLPLIKSAAPVVGLEVNEVAVNDDNEIDGAIDALKTTSDAGVIVLPSSFTRLHRKRIIAFSARYQLPAVYWDNRFVKDGGLMSYAYSLDEEEREGATYADRILKGEKPGDLPVQETTKFELVINLKTAKALGITMPASLLATANEVIE
jgi:putative ABC transport system substrate-binding protein